MKRSAAMLAGAIGLIVIVMLMAAQPGNAQDRTEQRLDALEAQVAAQGTQIAGLTKRVAKLESAKSSANQSSGSASDSGGTTFSGSGPDAKSLRLKAGVYKMTAHSSGGFFYIIVRDKNGAIISENLVLNDPQTDGSVAVTASADGDYVFEINGDGSWTVTVAPAA